MSLPKGEPEHSSWWKFQILIITRNFVPIYFVAMKPDLTSFQYTYMFFLVIDQGSLFSDTSNF